MVAIINKFVNLSLACPKKMCSQCLQKLSFERGAQLHDLQDIIGEISREIMWVNDREEEELMFDWGNKNIDVYIPKKQESYSVRQHKQLYAIQTHTLIHMALKWLNSFWSHF